MVKREEDKDLEMVVAWCRNRGLTCWHTENERKRNAVQQRIAKAKGLLAGVADLIVIVPGEVVSRPDTAVCYWLEENVPGVLFNPDETVATPGRVIAIELKREGERPSLAQRDWLLRVEGCGWETFVGTGREAISWLQHAIC